MQPQPRNRVKYNTRFSPTSTPSMGVQPSATGLVGSGAGQRMAWHPQAVQQPKLVQMYVIHGFTKQVKRDRTRTKLLGNGRNEPDRRTFRSCGIDPIPIPPPPLSPAPPAPAPPPAAARPRARPRPPTRPRAAPPRPRAAPCSADPAPARAARGLQGHPPGAARGEGKQRSPGLGPQRRRPLGDGQLGQGGARWGHRRRAERRGARPMGPAPQGLAAQGGHRGVSAVTALGEQRRQAGVERRIPARLDQLIGPRGPHLDDHRAGPHPTPNRSRARADRPPRGHPQTASRRRRRPGSSA